MTEEDPSDDSLTAASYLICRAARAIASNSDVLIDRHAFTELSSCLLHTLPVLRELEDNLHSSSISTIATALDALSEAAEVAASAASSSIDFESSRRSRLYVVISSRQTSRRLSCATRDFYVALSLLPFSSSALDKVEAIRDRLVAVEFRASSAVEEVLDKIESAVCDQASDRAYANHILRLVADVAGVSPDPLTLRVELDKLRAEVAESRERKDLAEAVQMDQIVSFLSISDAVSSFREREERYLSKRNRLGNQPLPPLQPFLCPITGDVMDDPVETSFGHTFEKSAIEKWFAEGNCTCPLTMTPLSVGDLRPNYTLKKSIEEWRERNRIITIANLKTKFESNAEQEVLHSLDRLEEFCKEDCHRDWIVFENYLPVLVGLLERKSLEIRCRALFVLYILAKDSDDTKQEQLACIDKLIEFVVMSLGRRSEERKLAVALLLELSRTELIRNKIGKARGCIFLLVTTTNDGNQAATDATQLLENLSYLDENVVKMAKANYFKPLLRCLGSGNDDVKKIMVTTLAEIELPDQSKAALLRDGALDALLHLVKHSDPDIKTMAVKSLQSLSSLPENGVKMISEGALSPLIDLLRHHHYTAYHILSELAATTIMNIISSAVDLKDDESLILLKSDDDIFSLFSLVNLTGPSIQRSILRTFYALCHLTSAEDIKYKLKQCNAIEVLIPLCQNNNILVRLNAIKLLSCLTEDIDASVLADSSCLQTLQSIIKTSKDDEEIAASMYIISNLPADCLQIIQWLLEGNGLVVIIQFLKNAKLGGPSKNEITENAARALCHFTIPTNFECQKKAVQAGVISDLLHLLECGTSLSKRYAAISLAQFSENSFKLTKPVEKPCGFFCCAAAPEEVCEVHNGVCSVEQSFCLLEAEAVLPLVRLLSEPDITVNEAALIALSTLIVDERLQSGSKLLFQMNGIVPIIKLLNSESPDVQVKAALVLERIFRLEEYKKIYGASAQMPLICITHKGDSMVRALAAKILAHLNVLHEQSSYF
ncbi:U-box domain-containing protein 44-like isoform X1 [Dendrobium catenatum]|uniref:U-box domain-containing protein 44-like isoform X1 n=1 Tax=Dendrobium catenatum TaxID=906689 RepID=UPI0009F1C7C5|nr:U-box domain-containing protein 44-like isoform X1 [Dendrobium catenatum]